MFGTNMKIIERYEHIDFHNGLENLTIVHISDVHLWYATSILKELEIIILKNNPDLVILTGDYYDLPKGAHNFRSFLCKISLTYTVVFIKGNHDSIYGKKISNLLLNIPNCICAEHSIFSYQSKHGYFYQITSWGNRRELICNHHTKNIVLIHNPEKIIEKELQNIHLILAGHLHGGQFIFAKTQDKGNFPGNLFYKYCIDRKQIKETTLVVSKGLGDTFPVRFNCPREVVIINIA